MQSPQNDPTPKNLMTSSQKSVVKLKQLSQMIQEQWGSSSERFDTLRGNGQPISYLGAFKDGSFWNTSDVMWSRETLLDSHKYIGFDIVRYSIRRCQMQVQKQIILCHLAIQELHLKSDCRRTFPVRASSSANLLVTKFSTRLSDYTLEDLFILLAHFQREDRILGRCNWHVKLHLQIRQCW